MTTHHSRGGRSPRRQSADAVQQYKLALLNESQQFASASKLLVRSAADAPHQGKWRMLIVLHIHSPLHAAAASQATNEHTRLCLMHVCERARAMAEAAQALLQRSSSLFRAQMLSAKVNHVLQVSDLVSRSEHSTPPSLATTLLFVLQALLETMSALREAHGKPLAAAETKRLMRQSTALAAALTQLIHAVRDGS